ncbi:MAG: Hsp20/alpha crystallin family protein [Trueperaceae bacterium]|nr:Hsp20/alpha crystallin family protein [Trueperaceae bacterium]
MANDDRKDKNDDRNDSNVDINIDLEGMFRGGLGKLVDLASKLNEDGRKIVDRLEQFDGVQREQRFTDKEGRSGVFGFTIRTGLNDDDEERVEYFGNVRKGASGPEVSSVREPITDVIDEGGVVTVIAELPGASLESIDLKIGADGLRLAASGTRQYQKTVELPADIDAGAMRYRYQNGILEVTLPKRSA